MRNVSWKRSSSVRIMWVRYGIRLLILTMLPLMLSCAGGNDRRDHQADLLCQEIKPIAVPPGNDYKQWSREFKQLVVLNNRIGEYLCGWVAPQGELQQLETPDGN